MKRNCRAILFGSALAVLLGLALVITGCKKEEPKAEPAEPFSIAVFVPGVMAGSPLYEQMVEGTQKAASEHENASVKVL